MKIAIVAGGTGGHIYPALTLAEELQKRGNEIVFIGSNNRMEKELIPSFGYKFIGLDVDIFAGGVKGKVRSLHTIAKEERKCEKLLDGYDMAIGFGNYISVPVILAAKRKGLKTVIHEQNSFAGKANKLLDQQVDLVIGSYEENLKQFKNNNTHIYGNPQSSKALNVTKDENTIKEFGLDPKKKTIVIFMGSLGSQSVHKIILEYLNKTDGSYQIIYAAGKQNMDSLKDANIDKPYIRCLERIDGVKVMCASDLVVSRAGATTLSEICALGAPSILIPSPYVPNNHQYLNAKSLVDKGAATLIEEKDLTSDVLKNKIDELIFDDEKLKSLKEHAIAIRNPNVLEDIIMEIEKL